VGHASRSNSRFSTRRCRGRRIRVVDRGRTVPPWSRDTSAPPVGRRLQASRGLPRTARWQCSVCPRSRAVVEAAEREPEKFGRLLAQMDFAARSKLPSSSPLRLQPNRVGVTFAFASAALTGSRSSNDCGGPPLLSARTTATVRGSEPLSSRQMTQEPDATQIRSQLLDHCRRGGGSRHWRHRSRRWLSEHVPVRRRRTVAVAFVALGVALHVPMRRAVMRGRQSSGKMLGA
jgi:hypothetical protein